MLRFLPVVFAAALAGGCQFPQFGAPKTKDSSPRSDAGLRPERGFRKKPNAPVTPEQMTVFAFLDDDKQRFQAATAGLTKKSKPSAITVALAKYAEQLDADKTALPADFAAELTAYRDAYRALPKVIGRLPDGSAEGTVVYDALAALFRGDTDKGKALGGDAADAVRATRDAAAKLYEMAGPYSLDVDR